ncbi:C1 family peptidase [Pseudomonas fitomaticsae]
MRKFNSGCWVLAGVGLFVAAAQAEILVDYRSSGAVSPVAEQSSFGRNYVDAAVGAIEGQLRIKKGVMIKLSVQQLMDCSGGQFKSVVDVYKYVMEKGIATEKDYPYTGMQGGGCRPFPGEVIKIKGYKTLPAGSEELLTQAIAKMGPISVGIDATENFQHYTGGVFDDGSCDPYSLDHGVLAVGYGSESGQDYYIVKNSWGRAWGESGYLRMSRNKNNQCGIATMASYPEL